MKIAPENASLLLLVSLVATFVFIAALGLIITGYVPILNATVSGPHTGSVDVSISEENEIKFQTTTMGNVDRFIIKEPDGTETNLVRPGDSVAFNVEDGNYKMYTEINGNRKLHQTIHPSIENIDVSQHSEHPDGNEV